MRVSSRSSGTSTSSTNQIKRPLSAELLDYINNYDNNNFKHINQDIQQKDKSKTLLDHQSIFSFNTNEDEYVSNLFNDTDDLMVELESMIFSLSSTCHLKDGYEKLKSDNSLKFGTHNENSYGFIEYNLSDVENSNIFITTSQSIVGVATTLVHELQHHYDLNIVAKEQNQSTNTFSLELSAFARAYQFLSEGDYIYEKSYISLPKIAKDIYINAQDLESKDMLQLKSIEFMSYLFEQIGYDKKRQFTRKLLSVKDVELRRVVNISNQLDSIIFNSKIKNSDDNYI